jgi:hypothetical protein
MWQLHVAYLLYQLSFHAEATWQVPVLSGLFFTVFFGNTITTLLLIPQKFHENMRLNYRFSSAIEKYLRRQNREGSPPNSGKEPEEPKTKQQ